MVTAHKLTPAEGGSSWAPKWTETRRKRWLGGYHKPLHKTSSGRTTLCVPWSRAATDLTATAAQGPGPSPRALWSWGSRVDAATASQPPGPLWRLSRPHGFGFCLIASQSQHLFGSTSLADGHWLRQQRKTTWTHVVSNCYREVLSVFH